MRKDTAPNGSTSFLRYFLHGTMFCNDPGLLNLLRSNHDVLIATIPFYFCFPAAVPGWSVRLLLLLRLKILGQRLRQLFQWPDLLFGLRLCPLAIPMSGWWGWLLLFGSRTLLLYYPRLTPLFTNNWVEGSTTQDLFSISIFGSSVHHYPRARFSRDDYNLL